MNNVPEPLAGSGILFFKGRKSIFTPSISRCCCAMLARLRRIAASTRSVSLQFLPRPEHSRLSVKRRRQRLARGRLTLIMGLFGVAFILITFGYIAWEQRNRLIQRGEEDIASNAYFLADHTARLLEVTDLTLKQLAALIGGDEWDLIEASRPHWEHLTTVKETLPYFDNLWLNDSTGRLRLTTAQFPAPASNVADRDAFRVQVRPGA